ncbi:MAG: VapE domain-containing protein [Cyclobacteriaceae bacterium]
MSKDDQKINFVHRMKEILESKYDFRLNVVKAYLEYSIKNQNNWKRLEKKGQLFVDLCEKEDRSRFNAANIIQLLDSEFVKEYHPFKEYYKGLGSWNGQDYIKEYCSYVDVVEPVDFCTQFKKWLVRTVKTAIDPKYFNKQAFIIVNPKQNTGKTSWCRFLVPPSLSEYITEHFEASKDGRIAMCRNLLVNLDELEEWNRKDIALFKSALSAETINERLPYARNASFLVRTCSFIGSTNQKDFINDETGSVRWLCFDVKSINFDYRNHCQIDKVWQQAYHLSQSTDFDCEMTVDELEKNEIRNKSFEKISMEAELINKYYEGGGWLFKTATDILCHIKNRENIVLAPVHIGRALHKMGIERNKHKGIFGYWLKEKF